MNLIEQLGGYERAKRIEKNIYGTGGRLIRYPSKDFDYNDDGGNVCDVELISFKANDLKKSLLEHRRENNIYEVGDKVVSTLDGDEDWKNAVCEILAFHKKMAITTGFSCAIHHYDYRHATDAEIKAGRRL